MYAAFPACEALTVQVPTATSLTVLPETVQTRLLAEERLTGRPELAAALTVYLFPTLAERGGNEEKRIVWLRLGASTVNDW